MAYDADSNGIGMPEMAPGMLKTPPGNMAPQPNAKQNSDDPSRAEAAKQKQKDDDAKREQEILAQARKRFKRCADAEAGNRQAALDDLKFKAGEQWPAALMQQRNDEKRPCLTINKIPSLTHQITNDIRQNRPSINVSPIGDKADRDGAQAFAGMIRAIERDSAAEIAYDTAITSAADIGFGYLRVLTEYESSDNFNQVVVLRRVRNPFTVYLDPERQEPDGCDAKYGFISQMMDQDEFKEKYPDAQITPWTEKGVGDDYKEWISKDSIRIAEYFTIEHEMKRLVQLDNGHVGLYDDLSPAVKERIKTGEMSIINERKAEVQKVIWRKLTAYQILETEPWPGIWIPIVEFVGEEIDIQGKVVRSGLIRNAKDPQRMKNYYATHKTEFVALAPKTGYLVAEGQTEGYETDWKDANNRSTPVLNYVPVVAANGQLLPPPIAVPPPQISPGIVEAEKSAEMDMMATSGVRIDPSIQEMRYDESGKMLQEHRRNNDIGSFHYYDNAAVSLRHVGRILVDLIPKVYDTRRVVTILQEDDTEDRITLDPNAPQAYGVDGRQMNSAARKIFNPQMGRYGVTVTTGPSYATKRIEAHDQMMAFAKALPEKGSLIAHLIAKYSDWPGSKEVYSVLSKALPPNLLTPDMRDLPPQLQAFVQALTSQISTLMAERMAMLKDLTDQRADRAVKKQKIDMDFEAKLMKLMVEARKNALQFDAGMVKTAVDATNTFHQSLAKQGFEVDNPAQDRTMAPMSEVPTTREM